MATKVPYELAGMGKARTGPKIRDRQGPAIGVRYTLTAASTTAAGVLDILEKL